MYPIIFNTKYMDLIKSGKKKQTIRKNSKHFENINVGDVGFATNYHQKIKIKITDCYVKMLSKLTDYEAKLDGFRDKKQLMQVIEKRYGKTNFEAKFIRFKIV